MRWKEKFPFILLWIYVIYFCVLAVAPVHRAYWLAVNIAPIIITLSLIVSYRWFRFSNLSYLIAGFLLFFQTLGAHYFFYKIPFQLITDTFHFTRNNFDRLVHMTVGFYAYPAAEFMWRKKIVTQQWAVYVFSFAIIMAFAGIYEICEWWYLILVSPESNADFLGAQGDIWDAQKDMLSDGVGALLILILFYFKYRSFSSKKL